MVGHERSGILYRASREEYVLPLDEIDYRAMHGAKYLCQELRAKCGANGLTDAQWHKQLVIPYASSLHLASLEGGLPLDYLGSLGSSDQQA